ncbi:MAG: Beta-galactosidase C-terminal domain [Clostridiales bacterium]|nr:MAG: Beta-galactosidase C-terminal domain [Clostridiales bacterium]
MQNFSDKSVVIKTDEKYDDILNRTTVTGEFTLNPYDVRVMKKTLNQ